jgi:hypothetical protein
VSAGRQYVVDDGAGGDCFVGVPERVQDHSAKLTLPEQLDALDRAPSGDRLGLALSSRSVASIGKGLVAETGGVGRC